MFDEKFKAEYNSIKAPEELYSRIMNAGEPKVKKDNIVQFRKIGSLAAAVSVILAIGFFFMTADKSPEVYVGTEKLTEEVHITEADTGSIMPARMNNEISCDMTLDLKTDTEITLNWGVLLSEDGEVLLEHDKPTVFSGELKGKWVLPGADASFNYLMMLKDKNGTHFIKLYFDSEAEQWAACLTK